VKLVGSVHVSEDTRDEVEVVIEDTEPDAVALELDEDRYERLMDAGGTHPLFAVDEDTPPVLHMGTSWLRSKMKQNNILPPGEADMVPASRAASRVGADVALIDKSMTDLLTGVITDKRFFETIQKLISDPSGFYEQYRERTERNEEAVAELGLPLLEEESDKSLTQRLVETIHWFYDMDYETLKEYTDTEKAADGLIHDVMVTDRDESMAYQLYQLRNQHDAVVAVVGKAHVPGIKQTLENLES